MPRCEPQRFITPSVQTLRPQSTDCSHQCSFYAQPGFSRSGRFASCVAFARPSAHLALENTLKMHLGKALMPTAPSDCVLFCFSKEWTPGKGMWQTKDLSTSGLSSAICVAQDGNQTPRGGRLGTSLWAKHGKARFQGY